MTGGAAAPLVSPYGHVAVVVAGALVASGLRREERCGSHVTFAIRAPADIARPEWHGLESHVARSRNEAAATADQDAVEVVGRLNLDVVHVFVDDEESTTAGA